MKPPEAKEYLFIYSFGENKLLFICITLSLCPPLINTPLPCFILNYTEVCDRSACLEGMPKSVCRGYSKVKEVEGRT